MNKATRIAMLNAIIGAGAAVTFAVDKTDTEIPGLPRLPKYYRHPRQDAPLVGAWKGDGVRLERVTRQMRRRAERKGTTNGSN